jgi:hypothetical protein
VAVNRQGLSPCGQPEAYNSRLEKNMTKKHAIRLGIQCDEDVIATIKQVRTFPVPARFISSLMKGTTLCGLSCPLMTKASSDRFTTWLLRMAACS